MCGIFGTSNLDPSYTNIIDVIRGLELLQHRGQESCGIAYYDNKDCILKKGLGLVKNVFGNCQTFQNLKSNACIGQVRYSTSGNSKNDDVSKLQECQPLNGLFDNKPFVLTHNGNIPQIDGHDTQFIVDFLTKSNYDNWNDALINLVETIPGSYCLLILYNNELYGIRDRYAIRPLSIGKINNAVCISSETSAMHSFEPFRDILPGEIVKVNGGIVNTLYQSNNTKLCICAFEFVYFLRENSITDGYKVSDVRRAFGKKLALKETISFNENTIVVGIPKSGIISAEAYADSLNLPYKQCITKNKNINRTFILPTDEDRKKACNEKFIYNPDVKGKSIIVVDDSIVRGNVIKSIISKLWLLGANEVHVRIPSPKVVSTCNYGIDIPSEKELLATNRTLDQMCENIKATSLQFLDIEDMNSVIPKNSYKECYGIPVETELVEWKPSF
tara:strand:+ start:2026 stop:3360 length:1335 start_codon:yes stop_codon:yes gene_type:complete